MHNKHLRLTHTGTPGEKRAHVSSEVPHHTHPTAMGAVLSICSAGNDSLLCQILRKFGIPDFEHSQSTSFPFLDYSLAWIKHCKSTGCKYSSGNGQHCRKWGAPPAPQWGTAHKTLPAHLLCPLLSIK